MLSRTSIQLENLVNDCLDKKISSKYKEKMSNFLSNPHLLDLTEQVIHEYEKVYEENNNAMLKSEGIKSDDINEIACIVNNKYQTLTYFGINKMALKDFVLENSLLGIDRIVPIGQAMDMGVIWDGYDLVRSLSRVIEVK